MSQHDVSAFLDRLTAEEGFRRDVGQALQGCENTAAATIDLAREAGFDFTEEEFDRALGDRYAGRELSDDELGSAAGGALTVGASSLGVVHKTSSGLSIVFPDVCKTPAPGGPVPIPYPTIGTASDSGGTKSTKTTP